MHFEDHAVPIHENDMLGAALMRSGPVATRE